MSIILAIAINRVYSYTGVIAFSWTQHNRLSTPIVETGTLKPLTAINANRTEILIGFCSQVHCFLYT